MQNYKHTIITDTLDTVHHLRLNTHNVLENGSASIFRQNGERREPTLENPPETAWNWYQPLRPPKECSLLGECAHSQKAPISFIMSVSPSIHTYQLSSHWTDFHESWLCLYRAHSKITKLLIPTHAHFHWLKFIKNYYYYWSILDVFNKF